MPNPQEPVREAERIPIYLVSIRGKVQLPFFTDFNAAEYHAKILTADPSQRVIVNLRDSANVGEEKLCCVCKTEAPKEHISWAYNAPQGLLLCNECRVALVGSGTFADGIEAAAKWFENQGNAYAAVCVRSLSPDQGEKPSPTVQRTVTVIWERLRAGESAESVERDYGLDAGTLMSPPLAEKPDRVFRGPKVTMTEVHPLAEKVTKEEIVEGLAKHLADGHRRTGSYRHMALETVAYFKSLGFTLGRPNAVQDTEGLREDIILAYRECIRAEPPDSQGGFSGNVADAVLSVLHRRGIIKESK